MDKKPTEQELFEHINANTQAKIPLDPFALEAIRWLCGRVDELRAELVPWPRTEADRQEMRAHLDRMSLADGRPNLTTEGAPIPREVFEEFAAGIKPKEPTNG